MTLRHSVYFVTPQKSKNIYIYIQYCPIEIKGCKSLSTNLASFLKEVLIVIPIFYRHDTNPYLIQEKPILCYHIQIHMPKQDPHPFAHATICISPVPPISLLHQ